MSKTRFLRELEECLSGFFNSFICNFIMVILTKGTWLLVVFGVIIVKRMKIGTKSLLFGVHQIIWHPIVVLRAWVFLYGWPTWKELICIFIHDWGYWGKPNLDGKEGLYHPLLGATIAWKLFGDEYGQLCQGHSRSYAKHNGIKLSKLCWADKYAFVFDPYWFYILRAKLSGELKEIRQWCAEQGYVDMSVSNREWYNKTVEFAKNMTEIQYLLLKKKLKKYKYCEEHNLPVDEIDYDIRNTRTFNRMN